MKQPRYFKYVGPQSDLIQAIGEDNNRFRKKEGFYISSGEEVLIKITQETELLFVPINDVTNGQS